MSRFSRWLPRFFLLVGCAFVGALIWHFGLYELVDVLRGAYPAPLWLMVGLILAGFALRVWKWRIALGPNSDTLYLFFFSKVVGSWTPGRMGELAPLLLGEYRNARMAAWVLADRVLEVAFTVGMGLAGILWLQPASRGWALPAAAAMILAGLIALIVLRLLPVNTTTGRLPKRFRWITLLHEEFRVLGQKTPALVGITALAKATDVWTVMALVAAFGYHANFMLVSAARFTHAMVSATPLTPETTGVPYAAAAMVLHEQAGIPYRTLTAALAFEAIVIYGLLHGLYGIVTLLHERRKAHEDTTE